MPIRRASPSSRRVRCFGASALIATALAVAACSLIHPGSDYLGGPSSPDTTTTPPPDAGGSLDGSTAPEKDAGGRAVLCNVAGHPDAAFCDSFDFGDPFVLWQSARYFGTDGGVEIGSLDAASPPRHARVTVPASTTAVGQLGATIATFVDTDARRCRVGLDYRLEQIVAPASALMASGGAYAVQSLTGSTSNVTVQLEVFVSSGDGGLTPRARIRIYKGATFLVEKAIPDNVLDLHVWTHLDLFVELAPPETVRIELSRDGALPVLSENATVPLDSAPDKWEVRLGGFTGGNPTTHRPKLVNDFDNVVVDIGP